MTDSTNLEPTSPMVAPQNATLILNCKRCGSHFEQDYEETLCWQCIEWVELLERGDSYEHAIRHTENRR